MMLCCKYHQLEVNQFKQLIIEWIVDRDFKLQVLSGLVKYSRHGINRMYWGRKWDNRQIILNICFRERIWMKNEL